MPEVGGGQKVKVFGHFNNKTEQQIVQCLQPKTLWKRSYIQLELLELSREHAHTQSTHQGKYNTHRTHTRILKIHEVPTVMYTTNLVTN